MREMQHSTTPHAIAYRFPGGRRHSHRCEIFDGVPTAVTGLTSTVTHHRYLLTRARTSQVEHTTIFTLLISFCRWLIRDSYAPGTVVNTYADHVLSAQAALTLARPSVPCLAPLPDFPRFGCYSHGPRQAGGHSRTPLRLAATVAALDFASQPSLKRPRPATSALSTQESCHPSDAPVDVPPHPPPSHLGLPPLAELADHHATGAPLHDPGHALLSLPAHSGTAFLFGSTSAAGSSATLTPLALWSPTPDKFSPLRLPLSVSAPLSSLSAPAVSASRAPLLCLLLTRSTCQAGRHSRSPPPGCHCRHF